MSNKIVKDTPIKYEDETVLAHGPVRSILSRPDTLHCSYEEFCETTVRTLTEALRLMQQDANNR